jgi:hypothetical protein
MKHRLHEGLYTGVTNRRYECSELRSALQSNIVGEAITVGASGACVVQPVAGTNWAGHGIQTPPLSPPKQHYPPPPWSFLSFVLPSHWSRHHPCLRAARPAASARTAPASPSEAAYFSSNALLPLLLHVCTSPPRHPAPITSFSHHMHHIHDAGGLPHQHGDVRPPRIRSGLKTHSRRCVAGSRTS